MKILRVVQTLFVLILLLLSPFKANALKDYLLNIYDPERLDEEFYNEYQKILPPKLKIRHLEYPAWLSKERNQILIGFGYYGVIKMDTDKRWTGTDSYYDLSGLFFNYNTKKSLGFIKNNTFGLELRHDKFKADVIHHIYNLDIRYKTANLRLRTAWNFSVFDYVNVGISLGYYYNRFVPYKHIFDYGTEINFNPSFWKYTKDTFVGFRTISDSLIYKIKLAIPVKKWDNDIQWLSKNKKRIYEFYLIHKFKFGNHQIMPKFSYSFGEPKKIKTFLSYNFKNILGFSILNKISEEIQKGNLSLISNEDISILSWYDIPGDFLKIIPDYKISSDRISGTIMTNFKSQNYGIKAFVAIKKKNKIIARYLINKLETYAVGKVIIIPPKTQVMKFNQSLTLLEYQADLSYLYQSKNWKINPIFRYIYLKEEKGETNYQLIFKENQTTPIKFNPGHIVGLQLRFTRKFKHLEIESRIGQYFIFQGLNKKSTNNAKGNKNGLKKSSLSIPTKRKSYPLSSADLRDNLIRSGFIAFLNFIYYF